MDGPLAERIKRWRATAELDSRAGQPVGSALREACDDLERLLNAANRVAGGDAFGRLISVEMDLRATIVRDVDVYTTWLICGECDADVAEIRDDESLDTVVEAARNRKCCQWRG